MAQTTWHSPITTGSAVGALGGTVLIFSEKLAGGPFILVPYAILLMAIAYLLRSEQVASFSDRFLTSLVAFMMASAMLYLFIVVGVRPYLPLHRGIPIQPLPFWVHVRTIGFLLAAGSGLSLAIAELTGPERFRARHGEASPLP